MPTFFTTMGTHQVGKFGAISPTDPDDISQSTPDFWPIFEFQALKIVRSRPIPLPSVAHSLPTAKFLGARPLAPAI